MEVDTLKIVLEVLLQELNSESDNNEEYLPCSPFKLPTRLFSGISSEVLEKVVEDIRKRAKEELNRTDSIQKIIYKSLLVTFRHTTRQERFLYLSDILEHFYNKLIQKLIELKKFTSILSKEDFNEVIIKLLPFVKLQVVKESCEIYESGDTFKVSLVELYETVMYPIISREDCYEIVKNKLVNWKDVKFIDYVNKPVDEKGGFLGEYFKLKISIDIKGKQETLNFFLKHVPLDTDELRKIMANLSFKKEEIFYMKIVPYLKKLGYSDITNFLPGCYLTRKDKFMVFDDVSADNFSNLSIEVPFTYEQISVILEKLAKFHSCSILFEEKLSELLGIRFRMNQYYKDMLVETFALRNNPPTEAFFDSSIKTNSYAFEKFDHVFKPGTLETFKQYCSDAYNRYYEVCEPSKTKRNIITHGDLWCNNFLFSNDRTSCVLIDFQMIRYNSPAFDVYFVLSTNTDLKTRLKYGPTLLEGYYTNLTSNLSKWNVKIDNILSADDFFRSVDEVKPTALVVSLSYLLLFLLPKEKMKHVYEDPELSQAFFGVDRIKVINGLWNELQFKSRFEDITQELYSLSNIE